jgi:hypothetical protein
MSVPTLAANERDIGRIVFVVNQLCARHSGYVQLGGYKTGIDLNSANTDNIININRPAPFWQLHRVVVRNRGTTGSLTTATAGVFTAAAAGGTALAVNQSLSGITSATVNVAGNMMDLTLSSSNQWQDRTELYFRVGTAQGAAATADVYIYVVPFLT